MWNFLKTTFVIKWTILPTKFGSKCLTTCLKINVADFLKTFYMYRLKWHIRNLLYLFWYGLFWLQIWPKTLQASISESTVHIFSYWQDRGAFWVAIYLKWPFDSTCVYHDYTCVYHQRSSIIFAISKGV